VQYPKVGQATAKAISDGVRRLAAALKAEASFRTPKGHFPVFYPFDIHASPRNPARELWA